MLKFFYNLYFQYTILDDNGETQSSYFNLGYFSKNTKAKETIQFYKNKTGFKEFPLSCFKIQKFGVNFYNNFIKKEKIYLYELSHEFKNENNEYEYTVFGVFSLLKFAKLEQKKQQKKRKYRQNIDGFCIDKWKVDCDLAWKEGFEKF